MSQYGSIQDALNPFVSWMVAHNNDGSICFDNPEMPSIRKIIPFSKWLINNHGDRKSPNWGNFPLPSGLKNL